MRLITFKRDGIQRIGGWIDHDTHVVEFMKAAGLKAQPVSPFESMQSLIDGGVECWEQARELVSNPPQESVCKTTDIEILSPLPQPVQLRDCMCFPDHLINSTKAYAESQIKLDPDPDQKRIEFEQNGFFELDPRFYDYPVYYITNRLAVHGHGVDVHWPSYSQYIDYELGWAAVIGKQVNGVSAQDARDCIFGYTIFNDWSARDEQFKVMGGPVNVGPGPGKDFANGLGPCIVTSDELTDPYNKFMKARVNGIETSSGNSSGMYFKFEDLIEYLSRAHSILPGEIIASGTVGTGCAMENGEKLGHGDEVELEVEDIGILRNRVLAAHTI